MTLQSTTFCFNKKGKLEILFARPTNWDNMEQSFNIHVISQTPENLVLNVNGKTRNAKFINFIEWPVKYINLRESKSMTKPTNGAKCYRIDTDWTPHYLIISPDNTQVEYIETGSGRPILSWKSGVVIKNELLH